MTDADGDPDREGPDEGGSGDDIDDPSAVLTAHERELVGWIDRLRERRDRLAELGEEFEGVDREDVPESVADSLETLLETLEADLDAQVADLEGDVERVRTLRATVDRASGTVTDELLDYVATLDGVLDEKRETVERLVATTDRLVDRFERVIAGR